MENQNTLEAISARANASSLNIPVGGRKIESVHVVQQDLAKVSLDSFKSRFAYYIDCQLATIERMSMLKRKPINELRRHVEIAEKMLLDAKIYDVDLAGTRGKIISEQYEGCIWVWMEDGCK